MDTGNTRKNFAPTKYPREEFWIHKVPTRKNFGPKNIHEKILGPRNTHEISPRKNFRPTIYSREKFWTHEIPTRKNFRPTTYPRENISDLRNAHEKKIRTTKKWHDGNKPTRPTKFSTLHSLLQETPFPKKISLSKSFSLLILWVSKEQYYMMPLTSS